MPWCSSWETRQPVRHRQCPAIPLGSRRAGDIVLVDHRALLIGQAVFSEGERGSVHSMSIEYEGVSVVALETLGIVGILGGMVPIARSEVSMGWVALLPVGLLSIALAVRRLASMNKATRLDISQRRVLLRFAVGCTLAGLLSSWLALAAYRSVILQVGGLLAGAGLLFCASVIFGGLYAREAE